MDYENSSIIPELSSEKKIPKIEKQLYTDQADTKRYLLLSFFIPCILVGMCWAFLGVHPFGDRQVLVTDFWHQYFPFANILHGKLQSFSSLFYTWESGLGSNFIAMMAYYAASPLNFLTVFLPKAFLRDGITFILLMKIGFAGLFTAMLLKYTFRRNDISISFFAVMYALCSYILGYSWNTIWMDTVALLPLVMLGMIKLLREKKCSLYIAALFLSLVSNYYIGLFICFFTVLAFFCVCIFECKKFGYFILSGFRMLLSTAVGAGLGAAMLIPAWFALRLTNSAENSFPIEISFYESWLDILANMTAFREPTVKEGLPNLYCGIICVVLMGMFLRSGGVRIREKIAAVIVLAFLIVSCNMNCLNFIWHGFHVTNMLPYRFSFLFSFVMIVVAYRAFDLIVSGKIKLWDVLAMAVFAAAFFMITWFSSRDAEKTKAMWISLAISLLYIIIMFLYESKIIKNRPLCGLIAVVRLCE
ncbi:MAG: YfhO family protein, partial [Ruminococcus sp.]|nr:YfhO family protein [Ruminococcus sp.]